MKYLVTGGAGFIGSNLVEKLLEKGNDIIILDNLHTGSVENIKDFKEKVATHIAHCSDVNSIEAIKELDGIFHLGMPSSSPMYKQNPQLVSKAIGEFITMLELAKRDKCKMVYASTSSLYSGNPTPWKEDMPIHVTDFYTEARYAMERLAKFYHDHYGVHSIGLRFFSVYGPREEAKKQYANLITQFAWAIKNGEQPVIYGDGEQSRDFIYVEDVVNALILGMDSGIGFGIYNVGTGKSLSLNQIIEILNRHFCTNIGAKYIENPVKNYVPNTLADTAKAEKELVFRAKIDVVKGIKKYL